MKKIFALAAAVAMSVATVASAETTQTGILGDSGDADYPIRVQGADGRVYVCKADTFVAEDGQTKRACRGDGSAGPLWAAGAGLGAGGAVAAGALLIVVLAANDGSTSTTTTVNN